MKQKAPSFNVFRLKLKRCYQEQQLLNYEKGKAEDFRRNWSGFTKFFVLIVYFFAVYDGFYDQFFLL